MKRSEPETETGKCYVETEEDGGVTFTSGEDGDESVVQPFLAGLAAAIVEDVPCKALPDGVRVATIRVTDDDVECDIHHETIRETAESEMQTTLGVF